MMMAAHFFFANESSSPRMQARIANQRDEAARLEAQWLERRKLLRGTKERPIHHGTLHKKKDAGGEAKEGEGGAPKRRRRRRRRKKKKKKKKRRKKNSSSSSDSD